MIGACAPFRTRSAVAKCYALHNEPCSEGHMQRRDFIKTIVGLAIGLPQAARARTSRRLGILMVAGAQSARASGFLEAFVQGLKGARGSALS